MLLWERYTDFYYKYFTLTSKILMLFFTLHSVENLLLLKITDLFLGKGTSCGAIGTVTVVSGLESTNRGLSGYKEPCLYTAIISQDFPFEGGIILLGHFYQR